MAFSTRFKVWADLPDTQVLSLDHLNDLELETRVKSSSGILIFHVLTLPLNCVSCNRDYELACLG